MKVSELEIGQEVTVKLSHWVEPMTAVVESQRAVHDQLHGDYEGESFVFRKIKKSGKPSYMFDLDFDTEPEILEVIG